jgi:alkaline phosphatase D
MWDTILGRHPDSLLLLGDNVYSDDPERPAIQRFCYNRRQSEPRFRRLVAQTPVYAIWDDHDFGDNDCHGGPEVDNPAWKIPVWEMFKRQWPNPGYGTDDMPGVWFSFKRDNVEFFCLDGRYYRTDPKKGREGSMLGPVQLQWLLDGLAASDATFKVIATPVPFAKGTKPGSRDTWDGYPEEREKIVSHIRDNKIEGVMILSADRHRSDLWKIENKGLYPLYEMESSRLTNQHVHETMPAAVFSYNASQSFGLVHFDTVSEPAQFTYEIVSRAGRTIYTHTITKDDLTFRE